jgi:cytochrome c biogenesis protein CcmG/thiol:disulfide interchange protein DsbE
MWVNGTAATGEVLMRAFFTGEGANMGNASFARAAGLAAAIVCGLAIGCGGAAAGSGGASSASPGGLVGQSAPEFSATAVANGKGKVALNDLRGQVVLVDFWGTFCEPCKKSFPKLQNLYGKYAASGLKDFASTYGAKFTLAWDGDKSIAESYKPETMPSSFLIDKHGVVRFAHVGYHDGEENELEKEIRELLDK